MFFPPKVNFSYRFENGRRYHAYKDGYDMRLLFPVGVVVVVVVVVVPRLTGVAPMA